MDLAVELRGPGTTAERRSVHLEWAGAAVPAPAVPPAQAAAPEAAPPATAAFTPRKLEPDEIASLRRRGEDFIAHGDVTAARLMLQRAAEAADARAAFALAATYDPIVLGDRRVQGVTPDPVMAKAWYERARAFGSPEAPRRLELLASREH
jgi:TPR repeat protein